MRCITTGVDYLKAPDRILTSFFRSEAISHISLFEFILPDNLKLMDNYLKEEYNIDLYQALFKIFSTIKVEHGINNKCKIIFSDQSVNDKLTLSDLAKLIDTGNLSVRGVNIIHLIIRDLLSKS